jgi:hypothetical protein
VAPLFLAVVDNRAHPDRRPGTAEEWRAALKGCIWPIAFFAAMLLLGIPALANQESAYADIFALLVCLSLAIPGAVLLRLSPDAIPDREVRIYVFEHGLVDHGERAAVVFPWEAVRLYVNASGRPTHLRLGLPDGAEAAFSAEDKVTDHVRRGVAAARGPHAITVER